MPVSARERGSSRHNGRKHSGRGAWKRIEGIPLQATIVQPKTYLIVKGFVEDDGRWYELNAAAAGLTAAPIPQGQQVLIVIGEGLDKARLEKDLRR